MDTASLRPRPAYKSRREGPFPDSRLEVVAHAADPECVLMPKPEPPSPTVCLRQLSRDHKRLLMASGFDNRFCSGRPVGLPEKFGMLESA